MQFGIFKIKAVHFILDVTNPLWTDYLNTVAKEQDIIVRPYKGSAEHFIVKTEWALKNLNSNKNIPRAIAKRALYTLRQCIKGSPFQEAFEHQLGGPEDDLWYFEDYTPRDTTAAGMDVLLLDALIGDLSL